MGDDDRTNDRDVKILIVLAKAALKAASINDERVMLAYQCVDRACWVSNMEDDVDLYA